MMPATFDRQVICFSPLAGINLAESQLLIKAAETLEDVSVPLRGLI